MLGSIEGCPGVRISILSLSAYLSSAPAQVDSSTDLHLMIETAANTSWQMAELGGVLRYVCGGKGLAVPSEFRKCFLDFSPEWVDPVDISN